VSAETISPEVVRARELDAQGRHDDAINQLAFAAQRGDVEATTQLAKRIIVGDRAPRLRVQGLGLLRDAVSQGGAEAADRLAVLVAAGADGVPDWRAALRLLGLAAERGWAPARAQLETLASMTGKESVASPSARPPPTAVTRLASWLAEDARLKQLLVPVAGSMIHADPQIGTLPEFASAAVCDWLVDRARGRLERARVYDAFKHADFVDESRTNSSAIFQIVEADLVHLLVQARMAVVCGQPVSHMEAPTVLHYAVGETIGNHYDFVDPSHPNYADEIRRFGNRMITFLIYLNDDYEGGETVFPKLDLSHSGRRGEGLFFVNTLEDGHANLRTLHNGRPPTRGEKWVFSQFIRNRSQM
jgi:prolyl 4-hydroxylase